MLDIQGVATYIHTMKSSQQMLPLDPDVDAILEDVKTRTKGVKRHIGNEFIRTEARRRGLIPPQSDEKNDKNSAQ